MKSVCAPESALHFRWGLSLCAISSHNVPVFVQSSTQTEHAHARHLAQEWMVSVVVHSHCASHKYCVSISVRLLCSARRGVACERARCVLRVRGAHGKVRTVWFNRTRRGRRWDNVARRGAHSQAKDYARAGEHENVSMAGRKDAVLKRIFSACLTLFLAMCIR